MKCYCCSGNDFSLCCERLLLGKQNATNPEQLMRSRYSAFATKNLKYIFATTDPQARFDLDLGGSEKWMNEAQFTRLEVLKSEEDGNKGAVEFKAYYSMQNEEHIHHEFAKFRKQKGIWYFRTGRLAVAEKMEPSL